MLAHVQSQAIRFNFVARSGSCMHVSNSDCASAVQRQRF